MTFDTDRMRTPGHSHLDSQVCTPEGCTGHPDWQKLGHPRDEGVLGDYQEKAERIIDPHPGAGGLHEEVVRDGNMGELIDRRVQVYGEPVECFSRIAQVWSGILGHEVQPVEVPLMMAGAKLVRAQVSPDYSDNTDDVDGYIDIARKIVGEDMIMARTVNDYIAQKWGK